jgi:propanol-preferring alcohol dehydrogenase
MGARVNDFAGPAGGIAWLHHTDGTCRFCSARRIFVRRQIHYGQPMVAMPNSLASAALPINSRSRHPQAALLLCAGIVGYRSLRLTGLGELPAAGQERVWNLRFGAVGHVVIQLARARRGGVRLPERKDRRWLSWRNEGNG